MSPRPQSRAPRLCARSCAPRSRDQSAGARAFFGCSGPARSARLSAAREMFRPASSGGPHRICQFIRSNRSLDSPLNRTTRRRAHEVALQALYESDALRHPIGSVIERLGREADLPADGSELARSLVAGVTAQMFDIDAQIAAAAPTWPLTQMARVDKNVLRLAIYEAFVDNAAVPARTAINDAIDLAKTFGSDSSVKFVNGVLATIAERRPRRGGTP